MGIYSIYEGNLERLHNKLSRIQKKCEKYNCDFHYEEIGEEYRDVVDDGGFTFTARFINIEVYGKAICDTGWRVVATIEHNTKMNIIRVIDSSMNRDIPEEFYHSKPICQHCNTNRRRKYTVLIYNERSNKYRQVGKQCLHDYTGGLDADLVSYMEQFIQYVEQFSSAGYAGYGKVLRNYRTLDVLVYAAYDIRHRGYHKYDPYHNVSTKESVLENLLGKFELDEEEYKICKDESMSALNYIRNLDVTNSDNYMHNLKAVSLKDYVSAKDVGILVSLIVAYQRYLKDLERSKIKEKELLEDKLSEYSGNIGDRIDVQVKSSSLKAEWDSQFGRTYLYKIVGYDNNIYMWYASRCFGYHPDWIKVTGRVKDHTEYQGIKQTILTRCKCVDSKLD